MSQKSNTDSDAEQKGQEQCERFHWCVQPNKHEGGCSSTPYTLTAKRTSAVAPPLDLLNKALIPLAALVVSGECVAAPTALSEEIKVSIVEAHDAILEYLGRAVAPAEVPKCLGYPKCDGTLPGEPHEKECSMFEAAEVPKK